MKETKEGIYDARQLGKAKMLILGIQHMFAMFGATILVPILVGGYFKEAYGCGYVVLCRCWYTDISCVFQI